MHEDWERYRRFLEAPPHITVEWHDPPTGARGWLVLNSLRGGAAGGGTRMRAGVTREEVTYLAKAMELKFAFSGPPIGGAKSGIAFDPADPRREEVLARWFAAVRPWLKACYGTGGDVAVDEQKDVVPACRALGIAHPQEGMLRGHLRADGEALAAALRSLRDGLAAPVPRALGVAGAELTVSDMITGFGVARAAEKSYELRGESIDGRRVIVEGFGNVGASCALYLARAGARLVGLVDAASGIACPEGLPTEEVEALVAASEGRRALPGHPLRKEGAAREEAYGVEADCFVPAAISGSVDPVLLDRLHRGGVRTLVCGANRPFLERCLGSTDTQEAADRAFCVVADVVGSLGMARAFDHLSRPDGGAEAGSAARAESTFDAVRETIDRSLETVWDRAAGGPTGLLGAAVAEALDRAGTG